MLGVGSLSKTSSPAYASFSLSNANINAVSSIFPPLEVLIIPAPFFIKPISSAPIIALSSIFGT